MALLSLLLENGPTEDQCHICPPIVLTFHIVMIDIKW